MKIQTMSVVVGGTACNAKCPYCISKCSGYNDLTPKAEPINWRNFEIACKLAENCGVQTVLLTGKGEPTLYPTVIDEYLYRLNKRNFPFIEMQTNGIRIGEGAFDSLGRSLEGWRDLGLTTICLSMAHYDSIQNRFIYQPDKDEGYMNLTSVIKRIHDAGLMVRLSCIALNGFIGTEKRLIDLIDYCRENKVKQLTVRPMTNPKHTEDNEVSKWISEHHLTKKDQFNMMEYLESHGTPLLKLAHGATVYDVDGQNVCWSTCMTESTNVDDIRQLIFFGNGEIRYSWTYNGAILLG